MDLQSLGQFLYAAIVHCNLREELEARSGGKVLLMSGASGEGTTEVLRALRSYIDDKRLRAAPEALGRQALHAAVLGFVHPTTEETLRFESPLPADFQAALDALNLPGAR